MLQKLTRKYLAAWGQNWQGKVNPHLYHYYREMAFKPDDERQDIVILSRTLPAEINLGYAPVVRQRRRVPAAPPGMVSRHPSTPPPLG